MKGLDTNVLVRYLVQDDRRQAASAVAYVRGNCTPESPCHINRMVLCELVWVLESAYGTARPVVAEVMGKILRTGEFVIEDANEAWVALGAYRDGGIDFADGLLAHTNLARGCDATATFDRKAARSKGFELLQNG